MKYVVFLLFVFSPYFAIATIRTVDNKYPSAGQFSDLKAAHDAANHGDTIYVLPSLQSYMIDTLKKRLTIIGNGWEESNPGLNYTSITGDILFDLGSDNSEIKSFNGNFGVRIKSKNIKIQRNKLSNIVVDPNCNTTMILQNHFYSNSNYSISIDSNNLVYISNNIIECGINNGISAINSTINVFHNIMILAMAGSSGGWCPITPGPYYLTLTNSNTTFENNIVTSGFYSNANFKNNIGRDTKYRSKIYGGGCCCFDVVYDYNVLPTNNNNRNGIDFNSIFTNGYHIIDGSVASKENNDGVEIGIYGGSTPFVDGGYPDIPLIYYLEVPDNFGSKQNGLKLKIKARSVK